MKQLDERGIIAARFSVRALVTVCAATLVLILSSHRDVYDDAVAELNTLLSVDVSALMVDATLLDPNVATIRREMQKLLSGYNASLSFSEGDFLIVDSGGKHYPLRDLTYNITLEELYFRYLAMSEFKVSIVDPNSIGEALTRILRAQGPAIRARVITFSYSGSEINTKLRVSWKLPGRTDSITEDIGTSPARHTYVLPFPLLELLSERREYATMFNSQKDFLPHTRAVWNMVRTETPVGARSLLARQSDQGKDSLQVFGLAIPEHLISWVTPSIIFALSVHLFIHLKHLFSMTAERASLFEYPWIPLMQTGFARFFSLAMILILPLVTLVSTVWITWSSTGPVAHSYSLATTILALAFLAASIYVLNSDRIRRAGLRRLRQ